MPLLAGVDLPARLPNLIGGHHMNGQIQKILLLLLGADPTPKLPDFLIDGNFKSIDFPKEIHKILRSSVGL